MLDGAKDNGAAKERGKKTNGAKAGFSQAGLAEIDDSTGLDLADLAGGIVVGDVVRFEERSGHPAIIAALPRRNKLARRSAVPMPSAHPFEQVIVANVDQVVPVLAAANPAPRWNLLDRYLVSAEAAGLPALICLTKLDLVQGPDGVLQPDFLERVEDYRRLGYPVVLVSAHARTGLEALARGLQERISVLLGQSGVGKTSLLNALQPGLGLLVRAISQTSGKGVHTTTNQEMFPLDFGGRIIDTPGVREFGLWDVDQEDLAQFFPEMRPLVGRCKFGLGCRHLEEPGCAIRSAVTAGGISPYRYQSYVKLVVEP